MLKISKITEIKRNKSNTDQRTLRFETNSTTSTTPKNNELFSLIFFLVFFFSMVMFFISINDLGLMMLISIAGIVLGLIALTRTT